MKYDRERHETMVAQFEYLKNKMSMVSDSFQKIVTSRYMSILHGGMNADT